MQKLTFCAVFNQQSWPFYEKVELPETLTDLNWGINLGFWETAHLPLP